MADINANKITVQVQVEPTPAVAEQTQADGSALQAETAKATSQQPPRSEKACPDAPGKRPKEATPDAAASGLPGPPMAADSNVGLPTTAPG